MNATELIKLMNRTPYGNYQLLSEHRSVSNVNGRRRNDKGKRPTINCGGKTHEPPVNSPLPNVVPTFKADSPETTWSGSFGLT